MALYTIRSQREMANMLNAPKYNPNSQTMWNALGRDAGAQAANGSNDNFFAKRGNSIENAIGTTGAAIASKAYDDMENASTDQLRKDNKTRMNDIAKKYGYNTYHDVWDARDKAVAEGDKATLDLIDNTINPQLQAQANANAAKTKEKADAYKDYRENNYVSKKINQDRGKFLGSAMNTLSTAADVGLMAAGIPSGALFNAGQGAFEGVADELEQNGLENFDWGRAGQNAAIGAAAGAATGALNNTGVVKNLGQGKISQAVLGNKVGQKLLNNSVGRGVRAVGTGAVRGALSGAVGGATGAGLSAAMNNQDILSSALQGAAQGAQSGAATGGVMAGANLAANAALNKVAPNVMEGVRANQARNAEYGDTMREQFKGAWNSGDSGTAEFLKTVPGKANAVVDKLRQTPVANIGNSISDINNERIPLDESMRRIEDVRNGKSDAETIGKLPTEYMNGDNNRSDVNYVDRVLEHINSSGENHIISPQELAYSTNNYANSQIMEFMNNNGKTHLDIVKPVKNGKSIVVGLEKQPDGNLLVTNFKQNTDDNYVRNLQQKKNATVLYDTTSSAFPAAISSDEPTSFGVLDRSANYTIPRGEQNVNSETEVYRTLTGESEPLRTSKEYEYRQKRNQKLLDQYGTIDKPTAKAVRAVETVGKIADAGFEKPADVEAAIKKITGSDGAVNKLNRKVIANAGQINTMDGVDDGTSMTDFIDQQIRVNGLYGTNDGNALATEIEAVLNQLPSRRDGTITGLDNAEDAFDVIQMLEKHAANYKGHSGSNYATSNPYKEQKAAVIDSVATVLKDRIYDASDVSQVVTPDLIADMKSWYPKNEKWAEWVDQNIATAKSGADLRAAQAPFVRMGRLIDNTIVNSGTFGSKVPRQLLRIATSNPLGVLINGAEMVAETPIGNRASAWVYDKLADRAARREASAPTSTPAPTPATGEPTPTQTPTTNTATTTANPSTQIYNAIGRDTGERQGEDQRVAQYLTSVVNDQTMAGNTLEGLVAPLGATTSPTGVYNSVYGTPATTANTNNSYFPVTGDYWTDILGVALSSAIDADDADAFGALYSMYQDALAAAQKNATSSSGQKLTATQQRANAAMNSLDRISNMTPDLAYNLSNIPIIGGIATFGGNDYEAEAKSLAQQIGYMVSGANIKEEEAYNIGKAYVPQPWDNEQVRQNKLRRAYEIIQQYQSGYAE